MARLFYQGHGSYRIISDKGTVIYVDPYAGDGYGMEADLALITHEHRDHNQLSLVNQTPRTQILRAANMLINGEYQMKRLGDVTVQAVPAYNQKHSRSECVGYLITLDGLTVYGAGDTSQTDYMEQVLSGMSIDYALLPIDGIYNMSGAEASECAAVIGAVHTIPIHMKPGALFDEAIAETFQTPGRLIVKPGEEILL